MSSNKHVHIKHKGTYTLMTAAERQWLAKTEFSIESIPAVLFSQNGSGADPLKGFLKASVIIHHLKLSLTNSLN